MNVVVKTKISYILERVFSWGFFTFFLGGGEIWVGPFFRGRRG